MNPKKQIIRGLFMPVLSETEFKEKIKQNPIGIYLLYGEENYPVKIYTERLAKAAVDESFADFNLHIFECEDADLTDIYENAMAVPMMAESKCVIVKNYPVSEAEDSDIEMLERLLSDNPDDNCLVFSYPSEQPQAKAMNKMAKIFAAYGSVLNFTKKQGNELVRMIESGARKRGKSFDRGVSEYMVGCVGNNMNLLANELEKVCAYSGDVITAGDIDAVCIKTLEADVFNMTGDLIRGNFEKAFHTLGRLFEKREDEFMILGAMISQYTDIYRAKAAAKGGGKMSDIALAYPASYKGKEFRLSKALKTASSMSFEQISECLEILAGTDIRMKSTQLDKKQMLEKTLVELARVAGRRI